jgi:hypothetical protein
MEIWDRHKAESMNRALEQRVQELEEERIAQGRTSVDVLSQHGSNLRQYAVIKSILAILFDLPMLLIV